MRTVGRRKFVFTGSALAGLVALAGCSDGDPKTQLAVEEFNPLTTLLTVLFPHKKVDRSVYGDVTERVVNALSTREDWAELRARGLVSLDQVSGANWEVLSEAQRIISTEKISTTPFFRTFYQTALVEFYSHPSIWMHVGYPGGSWQDGGYINRGFDDIDWLPEDTP